MEKLNGLDLFSGIGGITKALEEWVRPIAYCERDRYAQAALLSRMQSGDLPVAPIWDDVQSLPADLPTKGVDIIYGGFPCQDISVAGRGKGLEGQRSGLFFEIVRLAREMRPAFLFLENVPAIRKRGLASVRRELTEIGYDCRWTMLSAAEVGANHKRERWFLLAHTGGTDSGRRSAIEDASIERRRSFESERAGVQSENGQARSNDTEPSRENVADSDDTRLERRNNEILQERSCQLSFRSGGASGCSTTNWWDIEPNVGRVANGIPCRVDRLKCLGNGVVPQQAKEAFKILMGLK